MADVRATVPSRTYRTLSLNNILYPIYFQNTSLCVMIASSFLHSVCISRSFPMSKFFLNYLGISLHNCPIKTYWSNVCRQSARLEEAVGYVVFAKCHRAGGGSRLCVFAYQRLRVRMASGIRQVYFDEEVCPFFLDNQATYVGYR